MHVAVGTAWWRHEASRVAVHERCRADWRAAYDSRNIRSGGAALGSVRTRWPRLRKLFAYASCLHARGKH
eukprot:986737-Pleurochrysis_carterae.AAC.1